MASPFGVIVGAIDRICGEPLPIVRVFGWYDSDSAPPLFLEVNGGRRVTPTALFRYWRPDIVQVGASQRPFCGFIGEFLLSSGGPCFNPVELLRFGGTSINGLYVPGSLGGVFKRISSATLQAG
jgi:hypothetical protein